MGSGRRERGECRKAGIYFSARPGFLSHDRDWVSGVKGFRGKERGCSWINQADWN